MHPAHGTAERAALVQLEVGPFPHTEIFWDGVAIVANNFERIGVSSDEAVAARALKVCENLAGFAPQTDPILQQNLARAHRWANRLRKGESLSSIAKAENCSDSLIRSRVALAFLAPDLQRAILDGTAPSHLTTNLIVRMTLPHDWQEQAKALGL
ncbi:MAG: hypothetical protein I8H94_00295 [Rhodobacteraceae bacterium]|nr:hypothetical protein [Paracoccaceae bacterium]